MTRRITAQTTLDNLRKEAKRWLKALRAGAQEARARLERAHPNVPAEPGLRDVQLALAREHGLAGWAALKAAVAVRPASDRETAAETGAQLVTRFLDYACPDHHVRGRPAHRMARHAAIRILQQHPDIAHASLATAVVCGEIEDVVRILREQPELANAKSSTAAPEHSRVGHAADLFNDIGEKGWEPLLYLSFARLPSSRATENAVTIARALLSSGADPNVFFMAGDSRYTPLVGVIGEGEEDRPPHDRRDELARLLLEHGAEPYDTQVIYNISFHGEILWFLKLMHEFSVRAGRQANWDDPEWHMLDMGGYGTGARWHLRIAVENNDLELAEWCLSHGASPNAAPERDHSLYAYAILQGRTEMAELLARYGAAISTVVLEGEDAFLAACMRLDRAEAERLATEHPDLLLSPKAMFTAAKRDRDDVVELLLDLGVPMEIEDQKKRRPLHIAASHDALRVAELLIRRGAEIDPIENEWNNTPLDFAVYYEHPRMIALLSRSSRDIRNLTFTGNVNRLREVLAETPALAKVTSQTTPLFWLPEDESAAFEITELLLSHGADPAFRRARDGMSAADAARKRGMDAVAAFLDGSRNRAGAAPLPARSIAEYEQVALDLVAAHDGGDAAALERLGHHYGRPLTHEDIRAAVWGRVYEVRQRVSRGEDRRLEIAEARELMAREAGFGSWGLFIEATAAGRSAPGRAYELDRKESAIRPRRALSIGEWEALIGVMKEQRIASLEANEQITDAILSRVAELDHVTRLDLEGSRQLTDDGLQHLARMPQLIELNLSGCVLTDRALEVLRRLPNLRSFHMRWQRGITDAGVENLAFCEQLESVDLMGTMTGDGAIRALSGKPKLRQLKSGRLVTDAGLALLHHFPLFKEWQGGEMSYSLMDSEPGPNQLLLDGPFTNDGVAGLVGLDGLFGLGFFWHATAITPAALASLAHLPNLGFLRCDGALCDDTAMRHISAIPRLRMLIAQGTVATDEGFIALSRSRTLEYLWGRECPNLTGRGFAALAQMPALRGLGVSCKGVDDKALALLPRFPALRELMPMDVHDDGFRHVGGCEQLEALWCMYCRDTTDAATEQITGLTKLQTYYAGKTRITDRSLQILSEMPSLERLTFWETEAVTDAGVRLLKQLPRLAELTLEGLPNVTADVAAEFPAQVRVKYAP